MHENNLFVKSGRICLNHGYLKIWHVCPWKKFPSDVSATLGGWSGVFLKIYIFNIVFNPFGECLKIHLPVTHTMSLSFTSFPLTQTSTRGGSSSTTSTPAEMRQAPRRTAQCRTGSTARTPSCSSAAVRTDLHACRPCCPTPSPSSSSLSAAGVREWRVSLGVPWLAFLVSPNTQSPTPSFLSAAGAREWRVSLSVRWLAFLVSPTPKSVLWLAFLVSPTPKSVPWLAFLVSPTPKSVPWLAFLVSPTPKRVLWLAFLVSPTPKSVPWLAFLVSPTPKVQHPLSCRQQVSESGARWVLASEDLPS